MTGAEIARKDEAMLTACLKIRKAWEDGDFRNRGIWLKAQATIERRKPINRVIKRRQKDLERRCEEEYERHFREQMSEEELYEPFFQMMRGEWIPSNANPFRWPQ